MWYIVYPQLVYLLLIPEVFYNQEYLLMLSALVVSYLVGVVDTYFRPFSDSIRDDWKETAVYNLILVGFFIFLPFLVVLAFRENQLFIVSSFPFWNNDQVSLTGILLRARSIKRCAFNHIKIVHTRI